MMWCEPLTLKYYRTKGVTDELANKAGDKPESWIPELEKTDGPWWEIIFSLLSPGFAQILGYRVKEKTAEPNLLKHWTLLKPLTCYDSEKSTCFYAFRFRSALKIQSATIKRFLVLHHWVRPCFPLNTEFTGDRPKTPPKLKFHSTFCTPTPAWPGFSRSWQFAMN